MFAGECRCLLKNAGVCWRMLMFARLNLCLQERIVLHGCFSGFFIHGVHALSHVKKCFAGVSDPCEKKPCGAGVCKIVGSTHFKCVCPRSHRGKHCGSKNCLSQSHSQ